MKTYRVTVEGQTYEVTVEEVTAAPTSSGGARPTPAASRTPAPAPRGSAPSRRPCPVRSWP